MTSEEKNQAALEAWARELACPVCLGKLRLDGPQIVCAGCGRSYPVVDGIPVLIAERAEMPKEQ
jgi:uncharacterized protein YbaR (Trm112 family)